MPPVNSDQLTQFAQTSALPLLIASIIAFVALMYSTLVLPLYLKVKGYM